MKIEEFRNLVLSRFESDKKITEDLNSLKTHKEFLDYLFEDIGEYLENNIVTPEELINYLSPIELFHYGFLTPDNNPIDFTDLVTINGKKWYNHNEDYGIINEDDDKFFEYKDRRLKDEDGEVYDTSIRALKIKFDEKRLPKSEELEDLLNYEEQLGYYNGMLCKVFDKKLVFPVYKDVGYMSSLSKSQESYQCLYVSVNEEAYVDDCSGDMLIRCIKTRLKTAKTDSNNKEVPTKTDSEKHVNKIIEKTHQNKKVFERSYSSAIVTISTIIMILAAIFMFIIPIIGLLMLVLSIIMMFSSKNFKITKIVKQAEQFYSDKNYNDALMKLHEAYKIRPRKGIKADINMLISTQ